MAEPTSVQIVAVVVRTLRKDRGWSQEDFAARCNLHRTYVGAIERAEENLTLRTLDKLAKALQVRPVELLEPKSPPKITNLLANSPSHSPKRKPQSKKFPEPKLAKAVISRVRVRR